MTLRIALDDELVGEMAPRIHALAPGADLVAVDDKGRLLGPGAGVTIWLRGRWLPNIEAVTRQMPDLRWLHTNSAGVDHVLFPALIASDVVVTNAAGAHAIPISESVMGMMLAIVKRFPDHWRNQTQARWERYRKDELYGKTLTIIGTGHIARELARRARFFGMATIGVTAAPREEPAFDRLVGYDSLLDALAAADFVVIAAPLSPDRIGLIGRDALAAMRPTAWLINIARGALVDEQALLDTLRANRIAGAYLDVFAQEPLPSRHPFWKLPNVLIVPHNTGFTWQSRGRGLDLFIDNLRRWLDGAPLVNVVDKQRGY